MSFGAILSFGLGIAGPAALLVACVFEAMGRKMAKNPRCDKEKLAKRQHWADVGLVCAWLFLAAAYLCFSYLTADAATWQTSFESWMTIMLVALLVLDIVYLYLRRARPRPAGKKKRFWEI
ncbi:MAG: hypothetical protein LUG57_05650 [Oscillospiraceae bacterium]|nr:hypothetical protein [Oscillospiraceae bacterium]